jgi:predicted N-acetyltransferase YhbS
MIAAFTTAWVALCRASATLAGYEARDLTLAVAGQDKVVYRFRATVMPGCANVLLFSHVELDEALRGGGLGRELHRLRLAAATQAGAAVCLCTCVTGNAPQEAILRRFGWRPQAEFTSVRGNPIRLWSVTLACDDSRG